MRCIFCVSYVSSITLFPPVVTCLQTLAHVGGAGTWTSLVENRWLNCMRIQESLWYRSLIGILFWVLPRMLKTYFVKVFLSYPSNISHWSEDDFVWLVSTCEKGKRKIFTNSPFEGPPLVKLWGHTNDSKGKWWYFGGIYTFFLLKKILSANDLKPTWRYNLFRKQLA